MRYFFFTTFILGAFFALKGQNALPEVTINDDFFQEYYFIRSSDNHVLNPFPSQKLSFFRKYNFQNNTLVLSDPFDSNPNIPSEYAVSLYAGSPADITIYPSYKYLTFTCQVMAVEPFFANSGAFRSITLPESIEVIYDKCFTKAAISEFNLPEGELLRIDSNFMTMSSIRTLSLPNSIYQIGMGFLSNSEIETVQFGNSLRHIGLSAFYGCNNLKEIRLPDLLQSLGSGSFNNCSKLQIIRLPKFLINCSSLENCFNGAPQIQIIECDSENPQPYINCFDKVDKQTCRLIVPDNCAPIYRQTRGWKDFFNIIEKGAATVDFTLSEPKVDSESDKNIYTISGLVVSGSHDFNEGSVQIIKTDSSVKKRILRRN